MEYRDYTAKYVCRLCGGAECSIGTRNTSFEVLKTVLTIAATGVDDGDGIPVPMHSAHTCPDGSIGMTDFQGFIAVGETANV